MKRSPFYIALAAAAALTFQSCKCKQKTQKQEETFIQMNKDEVKNTPPPDNQVKNDGSMRLLISFISIGAGIDNGMKEKYDAMIINHPKKLKFEEAHWGREGEVDYYFTLSEMTPDEQIDFVKKSKELFGTNARVLLTENSMPTHSKKDAPPTMNTGNSRLIISFISIGQGTDQSLKEKFDKMISDHPKKPKYDEAHWGREGEVDYCFGLGELSEKEQAEFVSKSKEIAGASKLVILSENAPCTHKK